MYYLLDIFFLLFHTLLILFNLVGWVWEKTRMLNLITLSLTVFSWVVLGFWYGFGYCPCTDWHWTVRRELGYTDLPNSYITYLVETWTGFQVSPQLVNAAAVVLLAGAMTVSLYLNVRDRKSA